jgi:DNA repair exonuclease SbcCD ATPase subunit
MITLESLQEQLNAMDNLYISIITTVDAAQAQINANYEEINARLLSYETTMASIDALTSLSESVAAIEEQLYPDRLIISENLISQHTEQIAQLTATNISIADLDARIAAIRAWIDAGGN